jgi:hypothetical protein
MADFPGIDAPSATKALTPSAPAAAPPAPDKPGNGMFERMVGSIGAGNEAASKKVAALDASTMKMSPPKLEMPPKPEMKNTDPMEAWGSMAMVFAALASTKVRNHASTAMNAAASALKGIQAKDKETFDQNFKVWEAESKNALEMANFQQRSYDELLKNVQHKEDLARSMGDAQDRATEAKIRTLSKALEDPAMISALDHGGLPEATNLQNTRDRQALELKKYQIDTGKLASKAGEALAANTAKESSEYKEAMAKGDTVAAYGILATAAPQTFGKMYEDAVKHRDDMEFKQKKDEESAQGQAAQAFDRWKGEHPTASPTETNEAQLAIHRQYAANGRNVLPPITPENKHFLAEKLAAYQIKSPSDTVLAKSPDWIDAMKEAEQINPSFNEAKYDLVKKAREKITTGKDGDAIASYVRLNQHLQFFSGLVSKLSDGSDLKILDKLAAAWGRQTGNTNVTSYDAALQLVGDEMVKAATGTGAAGALGDREEIKKNFDPGLSKEQLRGNIDAVRTLVGGAIVSTLNKYRSALEPQELQVITGLSPEDLESYHVDPKVLQPTVKGPVHFGGKVVTDPTGPAPVEQPAATASGGGGFERKGEYNGKPIGVKDGKWVYEDGSPVEGQ